MNAKLVCFALSAAALVPATAHAQAINFEGYSDPTNFVSFTDSGATFTGLGSTTGFEISSYGQSWGTAGPMILCPRTVDNYCGGDFDVTFSGPVNSLKFYFTGDNSQSPLSVQGFAGLSSLGTLSFTPDGAPHTALLADLSSFGSLDHIRITGAGADPAGFGYDDFSFSAAVAGVPEPSTWAMLLVGFGFVGGVMRFAKRRQKFVVTYT